MGGEIVRAHIYVSGIVQGVGFRWSAVRVAKNLGLRGFVRNLPDGRVEIVVEGLRSSVDEFIKWCHRGPPSAVVECVDVIWEEPTGEFSDFDIRF
ncbi:MAG: acylphosphatase [Thermoprotei archaeon]|nr:MAG: acylphosphatase [Thermoprotei archaeon]